MRQICLDTETTGLDPADHRIIEIGCIEIRNRRITDNHFHCYINPEREIDKGAQAVHGISSQFLKDKPVFQAIVNDFLTYLEGADEVIIHNAPFDMGFLEMELSRARATCALLKKKSSIIDTLQIARKKHPGQKNNLDALCKRYGIDNRHRQLHGALIDADLLARLYLIMSGGQESLFGELIEETGMSTSNSSSKKKEQTNSQSIKRQCIIPVVLSNDEECSAHEHYLSDLKKDGKCLWEK